jgi:hypothetical protein
VATISPTVVLEIRLVKQGEIGGLSNTAAIFFVALIFPYIGDLDTMAGDFLWKACREFFLISLFFRTADKSVYSSFKFGKDFLSVLYLDV